MCKIIFLVLSDYCYPLNFYSVELLVVSSYELVIESYLCLQRNSDLAFCGIAVCIRFSSHKYQVFIRESGV